jgi:hypothetical protein
VRLRRSIRDSKRLWRDVMDCVERFNRSGDSTVLLENTYLESVGTRV